MRIGNGIGGVAVGLAFMLAAAAPAQAQYYPQDRRGVGAAEEIARGIGEAARAAGTIAGAVRGAVDSFRYRNPAERYAAETCSLKASRYGRVGIDSITPYKRRSLRVDGIADPRGLYSSRYDYDRRYRPRSFTCIVRDDGRVTRFKTKRLRY
jgi:hypothetical protein